MTIILVLAVLIAGAWRKGWGPRALSPLGLVVAIGSFQPVLLAVGCILLWMIMHPPTPVKVTPARTDVGPCQHCHWALPVMCAYCPFCGAPQAKPCVACEAPVSVDCRFCTLCGAANKVAMQTPPWGGGGFPLANTPQRG